VRNAAGGDGLNCDCARDVDRHAAGDAARKIMPRIFCAARTEEARRKTRDTGDGACGYRDARGTREIFSRCRRAARCAMHSES
jgi:hypothetical protein